MTLGSTQPLTEMSTRSIYWGLRRPVRKADNLPQSCAVVTKSGNLNFLEPSGPDQACNGTALRFALYTLYIYIYIHIYISNPTKAFVQWSSAATVSTRWRVRDSIVRPHITH